MAGASCQVPDQDSIELAVNQWSAWAPGLEDQPCWQAWAEGSSAIEGVPVPSVRFVEPLLRRRLSPVSRMAFQVAADCLKDASPPPLCIFCSRYGEFARAYELLCNLAQREPLSPNTFSLSVHNTSCSLFSIWRRDHSPATAIAAGEATLEAGFLEAWCALSSGAAERVLIVYHDEPLPPAYRGQATSVGTSAALALLLQLPGEAKVGPHLRLEWRATNAGTASSGDVRDPALEVLRLLLTGGDPIVLDSGRLAWTWSRHGAAH